MSNILTQDQRDQILTPVAAPTGAITSYAGLQTYIGLKVVHAAPMTRGDYNNLRGWDTPPNEQESDEGYLIQYADGGVPNHKDFNGYISWSPRDVFEGAYSTGVVIKKTTYVERMVIELEELSAKVDALNKFTEGSVFPTLDIPDREDLYEQLHAMVVYQRVLARRLQRAQDKS